MVKEQIFLETNKGNVDDKTDDMRKNITLSMLTLPGNMIARRGKVLPQPDIRQCLLLIFRGFR